MSLDSENKLFGVEDDTEPWDGDPDCEFCRARMDYEGLPCRSHLNPPKPRTEDDRQ